MIRKIRFWLALLFFVCTTLLFLDFTGTIQDLFGWMAEIQFLPSVLSITTVDTHSAVAGVAVTVITIVLTLLFGRWYCSVICPMGVYQDLIEWLRKRISKKARKVGVYNYRPANTWVRVGVLVLFLALILAGFMSIALLIAPYSSYGRMAQNLFQPLYIIINNGLASLSEQAGSYAFYSADLWIRSIPGVVVAAVTFVVVTVCAFFTGRDYCNTICPVGTILGFFARFSFFRVRINASACRNCRKCERKCKSHCINLDKHEIDYSRCVVCGNCLEECKFGALTYAKGGAITQNAQKTDSNLRSFLAASATLVAGSALAKAEKQFDGGFAVIEDKAIPQRQTPILPPGSKSQANFWKHCTGCQLCVAACPQGVLRPNTSLEHFMQPELSYERGYCHVGCNKCSDVCPTGAITLLDLVDKSSTKIGQAHWVKKNCVVLTDDVRCGNCARHCPTGAIEMVKLNPDAPEGEPTPMVPAVNEALCIGCGACENLCPARPLTAIVVGGVEVQSKI